ncbi:hypothetical protein GOBAR_DD33486 [Gossypium barbadense]|nr:hypothetical protein GOBAR_DD33486 [Gossypium barbadense]
MATRFEIIDHDPMKTRGKKAVIGTEKGHVFALERKSRAKSSHQGRQWTKSSPQLIIPQLILITPENWWYRRRLSTKEQENSGEQAISWMQEGIRRELDKEVTLEQIHQRV